MVINPYESPGETEGRGEGRNGTEQRRILGPYEIVVLCSLGVLLAAALLHRLQLGNREDYRSSPLIAVELLGMLVAIILAFITFVRAVYFLFSRHFAKAALCLVLAALAMVAFVAATMIDYPLMYLT